MNDTTKDRSNERGGAGVKLVVMLTGLVLLAHAGYNYVPVAYEAESLRTEMQSAVIQGLATPGKLNPVDNVKTRIARAAQQNDIPTDAIIDVKQTGNIITAHVTYSRKVNMLPFGLYKYNYTFDHTATPTGFLLKQ